IRIDQAAIDALTRGQLRLAGEVAQVTDRHVVSHDAGYDHVRSHVEVAAIEAELARLALIVTQREGHPDEAVALLRLEEHVALVDAVGTVGDLADRERPPVAVAVDRLIQHRMPAGTQRQRKRRHAQDGTAHGPMIYDEAVGTTTG